MIDTIVKNLFVVFSTFITLFLASSSHAVSMSEADSMANLQLAMLTLSREESFVSSGKVKATRKKANRSKKKANRAFTPTDKPKEQYPENCLTWSAAQINTKAKKHNQVILKYSRQHRIDSNLVKSIITAESCFRTRALSNKGAKGLMQLIPDTAERFGVKEIYDAEQNILAGTKYLRFLLDRYKGDLKKAIAAYNAGEGAVDKYKGIPPYRETRNYVENVLKVYRLLKPKKRTKKVKKAKKIVKTRKKRVHVVYQPPKLGGKPGRHGWQYNRRLAPQLYKH